MTHQRNHRCYATGCTRTVPPAVLMCARHWRRAYQQGQEKPGGPTPTPEYWAAVREAREAIAAVDQQHAAGLFDG